jgi:threonine dehydratase
MSEVMDFISIEEIVKAKHRISGFINHTPLITSSLLNKWLGHEIFFKAECFQKIGAFKARGACNTIAWLLENNSKPKHIVTNSSGNHAQAVAWAAAKYGIPTTIYMPTNSSKIKIQATSSYGANVILCETRAIADEQVQSASEEIGTYWIPPFNHQQVIAGQGTAVYDSILELGEVDAVFAPCGGGGLLSGSLVATRALSPNAVIFGAEPLNANDAAQSLRMNSIQRLPSAPDTLADGAMTLAVGSITFEYLKKLDGIYEIDEPSIVYWTQWLTHLLKVRIEPTSVLPMEAAFRWLSKQTSKRRVLIVLSGGNIDQETTLKIWKSNCLEMPPHF